MKSAVTLAPQKIVYISCDPQTQAPGSEIFDKTWL